MDATSVTLALAAGIVAMGTRVLKTVAIFDILRGRWETNAFRIDMFLFLFFGRLSFCLGCKIICFVMS